MKKEHKYNCIVYQGISTNNSNKYYFKFSLLMDSLQNSDNENNSLMKEEVEEIGGNNNVEDNSI